MTRYTDKGYTDKEERDALLDGVSALKYRAERLHNFASTPNEFKMEQSFRNNAAVLKEMSDTYQVSDAA